MRRNQPKSEIKSTSPYRKLYDAIDNMMKHGDLVKDKHLVALAKQLSHDLARFENNSNHQCTTVKHQFKGIFLQALHSKDGHFAVNSDNQIKQLVHAIHKNLYTTVFLNTEHLSRFSFFKAEPEEDNRKYPSQLL